MAERNARRRQRQRRPAALIPADDLPQRPDEHRQNRHRHGLADRITREHVGKPIHRQRVADGSAGRRAAVMKQPLGRNIHAQRRSQIDGDAQHIAHINQACAAQPHQRKRIEEEIRIEDGGQRAISVVGIAAQPHGELPFPQAAGQIFNACQMPLGIVADIQRLLERRAGSDQHRYTDRQQDARVVRLHAPGRIQRPEHAQRQRKEHQREFIVGIRGQIDADILNAQRFARRKLEFQLHVFTAFRQRQLNIAFPFARRQDKGARFDGRSVVAEHMQQCVAVVFRHPMHAVCARRKGKPRPFAFHHAVSVARAQAHVRSIRKGHLLGNDVTDGLLLLQSSAENRQHTKQ